MSVNSLENNKSRYARNGSTDKYRNRLGWWEQAPIDSDITDTKMILDVRYNQRPDILADELYGDKNLSWIILLRNNMVDPFQEFVTGAVVFVPDRNRVISSILSKSATVIQVRG